MTSRFYNINEMAGILGLTVAAVHAHLARRNYEAVPIPLRLGKRLAWPTDHVEQWIQDKIKKAQGSAEQKSSPLTNTPIRKGRPRKTRSGR